MTLTAPIGADRRDTDMTAAAGPALTDAELIRRSLADPERFAAVYDRHAAAVHRFAARRLGPSLAEDVVAETFVTAFRLRGRYRSEYPAARPWLFGIAVNEMRRHRRAETRMWRAVARAAQDPLAGSDIERAEERIVASGAGSALADALGRLPRDQRDVLLLAAWAELSYAEIASALDISVGTVRSRMHRARRRLRDALPPEALALISPDHDPDDHRGTP